MENEWLEVAYINFDEAILHGQVCDDRQEREVRVVLTDDQKAAVVDLNEKHRSEMRALLKRFLP